jgi:hypothetical protein
MLEELRKIGKDESFIEGVKKEAGLLDIAKLAPTMLRYPVSAIRAGAKVLAAGKGVTADAMSGAAHGVPGMNAMLDAAGNVVSHSPTSAAHLPGARTHAFASSLENMAGNMHPDAQAAINSVKSNALGRMNEAFGRGAQNAFQSHMFDVSNAARGTGPASAAARSTMNDISAGNFSHIENKMGLKPGQLANEMHPDVLNDAKNHAVDFNTNGNNAAQYNTYMNPEAAKGAPLGNSHFRFTPGKGLSRGLGGAMLGSVAGPVGAALGGGIGLATGTLGSGGAALAGGAGLAGLGYLGAKGVGMLGSNHPDSTGLPSDRNRAVPFMSNRASGSIGGALLGMLIANEMGLHGPMSWLAPVLGGIAGHKYLPQMMNRWQDPYGTGVNRIPEHVIQNNQQYPIMN